MFLRFTALVRHVLAATCSRCQHLLEKARSPPPHPVPQLLSSDLPWVGTSETKFIRSGLKGGVDQSPSLYCIFTCWNQQLRAHLTCDYLPECSPKYLWLNANSCLSQHPTCPCYDTCDKPPCRMWAFLPHLTSCLTMIPSLGVIPLWHPLPVSVEQTSWLMPNHKVRQDGQDVLFKRRLGYKKTRLVSAVRFCSLSSLELSVWGSRPCCEEPVQRRQKAGHWCVWPVRMTSSHLGEPGSSSSPIEPSADTAAPGNLPWLWETPSQTHPTKSCQDSWPTETVR